MKIEIVLEAKIEELAKELAENKLKLEQLILALPSELDSFLMSVILSKISTPTNMHEVVRTVVDNLPEAGEFRAKPIDSFFINLEEYREESVTNVLNEKVNKLTDKWRHFDNLSVMGEQEGEFLLFYNSIDDLDGFDLNDCPYTNQEFLKLCNLQDNNKCDILWL